MTTRQAATAQTNADSPKRRGRERGSVAVEVAILAPAIAALIVLGIVVGRGSIAYNTIATAAHDAARAASLSRTQDDAEQQAAETARSSLDDQGLDCVSTTVDVDASQLNQPVGQPATVNVTVVCLLDFTDIGLPMTRTVQASFYSPVDTWRGRGGPQ